MSKPTLLIIFISTLLLMGLVLFQSIQVERMLSELEREQPTVVIPTIAPIVPTVEVSVSPTPEETPSVSTKSAR